MIERRKRDQPTLEQTITAALSNPQIASTEIYELVAETELAIGACEQLSAQEHERARDPARAPDPGEALKFAQLAELQVARLQTQLARLRQHLEFRLDRERRDKYSAEYARLCPLHADAVAKFERVPELLAELAEVFAEAHNIDALAQRLALTAPPDEPRRFPEVELAARQLEGFSRDTPSILSRIVLLDLDGQQLWPPVPAPLDLSNYRPDDRQFPGDCGPDWWRKGAIKSAERQRQQEAAELADAEARDAFYGRRNGG